MAEREKIKRLKSQLDKDISSEEEDDNEIDLIDFKPS